MLQNFIFEITDIIKVNVYWSCKNKHGNYAHTIIDEDLVTLRKGPHESVDNYTL